MAPRVRKNPAAVALGRRGGAAGTAAQNAARAANALLGGRPAIYRLNARGYVEARDDEGTWRAVPRPYGANVKQWIRRNKARAEAGA